MGAAVGSIISGAVGLFSSEQEAKRNELATEKAAQRSDPFGAQRGYYQQILANLYGIPYTKKGEVGTLGKGKYSRWIDPLGNDPLGLAGHTVEGATPDQVIQPGTGSGILGGEGGVQNFMENNPAYQFNLDQTMKSVQRSASANKMLESGNMMTDLMQYGSGLASQTYDAELNRIMTMAGATVGSPSAAGSQTLQGGLAASAARREGAEGAGSAFGQAWQQFQNNKDTGTGGGSNGTSWV